MRLLLASLLFLLLACGVDAPARAAPPAGPPAPPSTAPPSGSVGPNGGSVDRLWFAATGDTRPGSCDATDQYPRAAVAQLASSMKALSVQFALDLGDHMFVCNQSLPEARQQMGFYMGAIAAGPATWWLTMGNHECGAAYSGGGCAVGRPDANFDAYLEALARPRPWYANDVQTSLGLARFVVIADDAWGAEQAAWLESTLADADAHARYTILARHHPVTGSRTGPGEILAAIGRHKATLILTAHTHSYAHDGPRSAIIGLGGAGPSTGFATVLQNADGTLTFTLHDASGNPLGAPWSVAPQ